MSYKTMSNKNLVLNLFITLDIYSWIINHLKKKKLILYNKQVNLLNKNFPKYKTAVHVAQKQSF